MQDLQQILNNAKKYKWPYPKTFAALKTAGTQSYQVHFSKNYHATYQGDFGTWQEIPSEIFESLTIAQHFSKPGIITALQKHAAEKTSYSEFLTEIAASGVSHYKVDMNNRTVTYFNEDETEQHQESVPTWQD